MYEDSATMFHRVLPTAGKLNEEELSGVFAGNWLGGGSSQESEPARPEEGVEIPVERN